jgi:hypothetical protein
MHISKILSLDNGLGQITIMKAESENLYKTYYDIDRLIERSPIPIKIINCPNWGFSAGQWLKCYEQYKDDFDFYMFLEDDYCPNMDRFDTIIRDIYHQKFVENQGVLCSFVQGTRAKRDGSFPIHFEGGFFVSSKSLERLYNFARWEQDPRSWLHKINNETDDHYNWSSFLHDGNSYIGGYYQLTFSHLFTLAGMEHADYLGAIHQGKTLYFPYWADTPSARTGGELYFGRNTQLIKEGTAKNLEQSPIIPIQLSTQTFLDHHCENPPSSEYPDRNIFT